MRASTDRIRNARSRTAELQREMAAEAAAAADAERRDAEEASALRSATAAARARIDAITDEEAGVVLAAWDSESAGAAAAVRAEFEAPLAAARSSIDEDAASYAAASRRRARDVADAFAFEAAAVVRGAVDAALLRLEAQAAAAGAALPRLTAARARLARLYRDVHAGRDPGDDVSSLSSAFPHLPLDADGDWDGFAAGNAAAANNSSPPPGAAARSGVPPSASGGGDAINDADGALEAREAAAMGSESVGTARAELAALADRAMAAWAGATDACDAEEALGLLRAVLRVAALAPRPGVSRASGPEDGNDGSAPLTDVAAYLREVARATRVA